MGSNYPQHDIDEAFLEARRRSTGSKQQAPQQDHQPTQGKRKKGLILIGLIVILLVIAGLAYYMFFMDNGGDTPKDTTTTRMKTTTTFRSTSTVPRTTTTTVNVLNTPKDGPVRLFEVLLCNDIDQYFNCFENKYGIYEKNETVYIYFKLLFDAKEMTPGSGLYKIGFVEETMTWTSPDGEEKQESSLLDVTREVPDSGTYSLPAYNIIKIASDATVGDYNVMINIKDKYSDYSFDINAKYKVVEG